MLFRSPEENIFCEVDYIYEEGRLKKRVKKEYENEKLKSQEFWNYDSEGILKYIQFDDDGDEKIDREWDIKNDFIKVFH